MEPNPACRLFAAERVYPPWHSRGALRLGPYRINEEPQNLSVGIPLAVGEQPFLNCKVDYRCCLDRDDDFLAVEKSKLEVVPMAGAGPIFRYEYGRNSGKVPSVHMHVHAHRGAFTFLMAKAVQSTRRARSRPDANSVPSLQSIHFLLGGHRFRPRLEVVLETLIEEFGVGKQKSTQATPKDRRAQWRRTQTRAVVRVFFRSWATTSSGRLKSTLPLSGGLDSSSTRISFRFLVGAALTSVKPRVS